MLGWVEGMGEAHLGPESTGTWGQHCQLPGKRIFMIQREEDGRRNLGSTGPSQAGAGGDPVRRRWGRTEMSRVVIETGKGEEVSWPG